MSKQFRAQDEGAVMEQLHSTNMSLAIMLTAAMEYFGPFPPELDKRLTVLLHGKQTKYPPPSLERLLADVKAVVSDFKQYQLVVVQ